MSAFGSAANHLLILTQYLNKVIRELQMMQDRVLADIPLDDEAESPLSEIVPPEWRFVVPAGFL